MRDALTLTTRAIEAVDEELNAHKSGRGRVGNLRQLAAFRDNLKTMKHQIESGNVPPRDERLMGMGRIIADSWPYDNELGKLILEAEQQYLKM